MMGRDNSRTNKKGSIPYIPYQRGRVGEECATQFENIHCSLLLVITLAIGSKQRRPVFTNDRAELYKADQTNMSK